MKFDDTNLLDPDIFHDNLDVKLYDKKRKTRRKRDNNYSTEIKNWE